MQQKHLLIIIGIIIIIFIIFILIIWLSTRNKNKYNNDNDNCPISNRKNGKLYESCPCADGLICDNGICKNDEHSFCVTSSSCPEGYFCFNGKCVEKPYTEEEVKSTGFSETKSGFKKLCVYRHFLRLDSDRFVISPGWWSNAGGISICDSNITGQVYILRNDGLFRAAWDSHMRDIIQIKTTIVIDKLFRYMGILYILSEGMLYKVVNEDFRNYSTPICRWDFRREKTFLGKDVYFDSIDDVFPCNDGTISLLMEEGIWTYSSFHRDMSISKTADENNIKNIKSEHKGKWELEYINDNVRKICYGKTRNCRIILKDNEIEFYIATTNVNRKFNLPGYYIDVELNLDEDGFIAIRDTIGFNECLEYRPVVKRKKDENNNEIKFNKRKIIGDGDSLMRTKNNVWMLTGTTCLAI